MLVEQIGLPRTREADVLLLLVPVCGNMPVLDRRAGALGDSPWLSLGHDEGRPYSRDVVMLNVDEGGGEIVGWVESTEGMGPLSSRWIGQGVEWSGGRVGGIRGADNGFVVQANAVRLCQWPRDEVLMREKVSDQYTIDGKGMFWDCRRVAEGIGGGRWRSKAGCCLHFVKLACLISSLGLWVGYRWKARMACGKSVLCCSNGKEELSQGWQG